MSSKEKLTSVPAVVVDKETGTRYSRGQFLGKGGFAKCYELTDLKTKEIFAGKVVSKSLLVKQHQKEKMTQEIAIHRSLKHKHIVGFHSFFEDDENVYIILELCRRRSLMEMHKRRKVLTEPEVRYFIRQIVLSCKYLHDEKVIHRDLKLGNLFLNEEMEIKLGDFGLATKVDYKGERKKTLCGTPNYIAPEVLSKRGHSFEVDVWSLGCILYTLLVGKPPFETSSLKDTYVKIKKNDYLVPARVSLQAKHLIMRLLRNDPKERPSMENIQYDEFLVNGYIPPRLPVSCLSTAPRFDSKSLAPSNSVFRKPLLEINKDSPNGIAKMAPSEKLADVPEHGLMENEVNSDKAQKPSPGEIPPDFYLGDLSALLASVVLAKPAEKTVFMEDDAEDPAAMPIFWVSKWVDYTDKYGLGFQLCDNSVGVLFNDSTRIILLADGQNIHYIERDTKENYYELQNFPEALAKKVTLLKYFRNYMNEHLLKAGESIRPREGDELIRLPYLRAWFRTRSAIVFHLNNGTLQINFFQDHTKIILCPLMGAVSYIDENKEFRTFRLKLIEKFGCSRELFSRLRYAKTMVDKLISTKSGSLKKS